MKASRYSLLPDSTRLEPEKIRNGDARGCWRGRCQGEFCECESAEERLWKLEWTFRWPHSLGLYGLEGFLRSSPEKEGVAGAQGWR